MDRFVWFVLLVVTSHLVTEFTRVTGYNRGPRQDVVTVNDSSTQPIRAQNLMMYPGQEYGLYEQQDQQYYSGNNLYSNYANNNKNYSNKNNNNFLSSLFNQFMWNNQNGQHHQQHNQQQQQRYSPTSNSVSSNNLLNLPSSQQDVKTFSLRPLIDSIFEIPISALRAVNNLLGRLTGGYSQQQPAQQQQPTKYYSYPFSQSPYPYYGRQKSAETLQPKSQFEMLNQKEPSTEVNTKSITVATTMTIRSLHSGVRR